jgi:HSP20 family protein
MTNQTEAQTKDGEEPKTAIMRRRSRFPDLFDEMDRFWEAFIPTPWRFRPAGRQGILPAVDVFEKDGQLHINAELPGIKDKDVEIEVTDDVLTISGEKRDEREVKSDDFYRSERSFGSFHRQISLPAGADTDDVEATFKDGVLKIVIPVKAATPSAKKIEVKKE